MADRFTEWLEEGSLYVALLAAWIAMLGSLYFSEVAGYIPCTFCWYQRILMYPLTAVIAVGLLRRDRHLPLLVLPFSVLGIGISGYHYLLQKTDLFMDLATCQVGVPCSGIWINWFGFVTIPFLALTAFVIITFSALIAWQAGQPAEADWEDERPVARPWIPVIGIIAVVSIAFFILGQMGRANAQDHTGTAVNEFPVIATGAQSTIEGAAGQAAVDPESLAMGQDLYRGTCAPCHGAEAEGVPNVGAALTTSPLLREGTEAEVLAYIRSGGADHDLSNGAIMPASGGRPDLSDEAMVSIIRYLHAQVAETEPSTEASE